MAVVCIHKDFCFQLGILCLVNIKTDAAFAKGGISSLKIFQSISDRVKNMLFPLLLRHGISGNGILKTAQLCAGIAAEGFCGPLGEKNFFTL